MTDSQLLRGAVLTFDADPGERLPQTPIAYAIGKTAPYG